LARARILIDASRAGIKMPHLDAAASASARIGI
jgi:hypothetical protein